MSRVLIACVAAVLSVAAAVAGTDEEIVNYLVKGNQYMGSNEPEKALMEFQKAVDYARMVKADKEFPMVYFNRGRAYERTGELEKAVADYTKALTLNSEYLLAYYHRAVTYHKMNRLDSALADYDAMIALEPGVHAYNNKGIILEQKGEGEKAIAAFDMAVKTDPKAVNVHLNRGLSHLNRGDYTRAGEDFYLERQINPGSTSALLFETALQQVHERKYVEAVKSFRKLKDMGYALNGDIIRDIQRKAEAAAADKK